MAEKFSCASTPIKMKSSPKSKTPAPASRPKSPTGFSRPLSPLENPTAPASAFPSAKKLFWITAVEFGRQANPIAVRPFAFPCRWQNNRGSVNRE
jgi:hypothetical protein